MTHLEGDQTGLRATGNRRNDPDAMERTIAIRCVVLAEF